MIVVIFMKVKQTQLGYLTQESHLDLNLTIHEELLSVFNEVITMEQRLRTLEKMMGNSQQIDNIMKEYDDLTHCFNELEGYSYESKITGVLKGLGI